MNVQTGLEVFCRERKKWLEQERVGLVTHPAAVLPDYTSSQDALLRAGVNLKALFWS